MNRKALINKIKENDKETYYSLYNKYFEKLVKYVFLIVNNRDDAEDIVQNIFINLHSKIESFKDKNFKSWIFVIAKNEAIDFLRSGYKRKVIVTENDESFSSLDKDNEFDIAELREVLSKDEYEVTYLYYKCGLNYKEVCKVENITDYQFRQIMKNAKNKVENYYEEVYLCTKGK